ncbi:VapC toxin family PIN domain ribonuclease [Streptomyces silvisoli]|uniref:Ribonuclease VapC n=1 Tax=Streptomyces silvisoli TaxID=3034235 RepID=A0ABT5ZEF5_9ACTN|nr:VapC toxin family PIN domain ribonuclease [Streptomyces silvisoli]MDF3288209.1 VapC toxin family PIN domain ribonuclease [Streptomyces silvisoli]
MLADGADRFLIDASAAARVHRAAALEKWAPVLRQGRVGMCEATRVQLLRSARSADEYDRLADGFASLYGRYGVTEEAWTRARALQRNLVRAGCHRSAGVAGLLVAVTALDHRLTLLHYDRGFETIAQHTELKTRWLAEPGSLG